MSTGQWLITIVTGLAVNELCDVSPWLARRLVRWAARRRYLDLDRAELRAREWTALVDERPGKVFKLATAGAFAASAALVYLRRTVGGRVGTAVGGFLADATDAWQGRARFGVAGYLLAEERYRGEWRRHWIQPAAKAAAVSVLPGAGIGVALAWASGWNPAVITVASIVAGLAVLASAGWQLARWYVDRFVLTDQRLMVITGFRNRRAVTLPLSGATGLTLIRTPLGRFLSYGTLQMDAGVPSLRRIKSLPKVVDLYLQIVEELYDPETSARRRDTGR